MNTASAGLTEFLLKRIAEDERLTGIKGPERHVWELEQIDDSRSYCLLAIHEKRVRAECAAKRGIISDHEDWERQAICPTCSGVEFIYPCRTLRRLGEVYMDHPDYRGAWRP